MEFLQTDSLIRRMDLSRRSETMEVGFRLELQRYHGLRGYGVCLPGCC